MKDGIVSPGESHDPIKREMKVWTLCLKTFQHCRIMAGGGKQGIKLMTNAMVTWALEVLLDHNFGPDWGTYWYQIMVNDMVYYECFGIQLFYYKWEVRKKEQ